MSVKNRFLQPPHHLRANDGFQQSDIRLSFPADRNRALFQRPPQRAQPGAGHGERRLLRVGRTDRHTSHRSFGHRQLRSRAGDRQRGAGASTAVDRLVSCRKSTRPYRFQIHQFHPRQRQLRFGTAPAIPLPLGISFFTFHIISYLVDVYRGVAQPQRSAITFTLYIINFPQLIAGPIIRYRPIAPQLEQRPVSFGDVDVGIARFAAGLAKKLLIANPVGAVGDHLFAMSPADLPIWAVWLAVLCFSLQIYFDFSGYSDMAIGMARVFGFRFPENFNYPYSSVSIKDFWRRWHITLSAWFRDYVYVPLGGSRGSTWSTTRNLWVVFLLCGTWHGASWNFIVWGMWHGLFLSIERLAPVERALSGLPRIVRNAYTLLVVMIGWVFFRAATLDLALDTLARMFGIEAGAPAMLPVSAHVTGPTMLLIVIAAFFSFPIWPRLRERMQKMVGTPGEQIAYDLTRAAYIGLITVLCLATMTIDQNNPFIYFRF
ncbi:MAG: MBOAT family protein [Alphaproteobacteria bacterium]|nr:MAG: MBOAT family protein [Alphaproteobacteria bacterium]